MWNLNCVHFALNSYVSLWPLMSVKLLMIVLDALGRLINYKNFHWYLISIGTHRYQTKLAHWTAGSRWFSCNVSFAFFGSINFRSTWSCVHRVQVSRVNIPGGCLNDLRYQTLTWKPHIQQVRNKVSRGTGILKKLRPYVNNDTILGLYYSFIYPYFTFCVKVWGKTYQSNLDCIVKLQKRVIRLLAGVHPLTHKEPIFFRLKILKFTDVVNYIIGIFMYKVYHQDIPRVFENYYTDNRNVHDYATRQVDHIYIAYAGTNRRNMTMRFQGGKVWNSIVRNKIPYNGSIYIFKREFKSFSLNCYNWAGGP